MWRALIIRLPMRFKTGRQKTLGELKLQSVESLFGLGMVHLLLAAADSIGMMLVKSTGGIRPNHSRASSIVQTSR